CARCRSAQRWGRNHPCTCGEGAYLPQGAARANRERGLAPFFSLPGGHSQQCWQVGPWRRGQVDWRLRLSCPFVDPEVGQWTWWPLRLGGLSLGRASAGTADVVGADTMSGTSSLASVCGGHDGWRHRAFGTVRCEIIGGRTQQKPVLGGL